MVYMFGLVGAHPSDYDQLLLILLSGLEHIILELVHKQVLPLVLDSLYIVTCVSAASASSSISSPASAPTCTVNLTKLDSFVQDGP